MAEFSRVVAERNQAGRRRPEKHSQGVSWDAEEMYSVELYGRVRRAVFVEGISRREAARRFGLARETVREMLSYAVPPGYRREKPIRRPKLDSSTGVIDQIILSDEALPENQRHMTQRMFERLGDGRSTRQEPG